MGGGMNIHGMLALSGLVPLHMKEWALWPWRGYFSGAEGGVTYYLWHLVWCTTMRLPYMSACAFWGPERGRAGCARPLPVLHYCRPSLIGLTIPATTGKAEVPVAAPATAV